MSATRSSTNEANIISRNRHRWSQDLNEGDRFYEIEKLGYLHKAKYLDGSSSSFPLLARDEVRLTGQYTGYCTTGEVIIETFLSFFLTCFLIKQGSS